MRRLKSFRNNKIRVSIWVGGLLLLTGALLWLADRNDVPQPVDPRIVNDFTQLNPIYVARVIEPRSTADIVTAIRDSSGPISIGGGRYSMGGQTAIEDSLHIDMRQFNRILSFSAEKKEITVQAGITWRAIQRYIDPYDLSVMIMQTYSDFTVGGSLSVNVHGRYIGKGPVIHSVKSIRLVLADGSLVETSPKQRSELFYAAIGGYGGVGVIVEATLALDRNEKVERRTSTMPIANYPDFFTKNVRDNQEIIFHNADIYPPAFERVREVSWHVSQAELTNKERLIPVDREYVWLPMLAKFASGGSLGKWTREHVLEPIYYSEQRVVWRNWEASYDVRELGGKDRRKKTYVLQEYFIPVANLTTFVPKMRAVFQKYDVDVLNVSIRHALSDPGSYLAWARKEVFALVVYHGQGTTSDDKAVVGNWTREMIDAVLSEGGTYYLPYQPHATVEQFNKAYPDAAKFFAIKRKVDPTNRFQNKLWEKYYPLQQVQLKGLE